MPEMSGVADRMRSAIASLSGYIEELPSARELPARVVGQYREETFVYGWEIEHQFSDGTRKLHVLIDRKFPFSMPRVALVDRPPFLTWPHVERDGMLCLYPNSITFDVDFPVQVLAKLLEWAVDLIEGCISKTTFKDFQNEFNTYWGYASTENAKLCLSLLDLENRSNRRISVWRGTSVDLVGDSSAEIHHWLSKRYGKVFDSSDEAGALLWLREMPVPSAYPRTVTDLVRLLGGAPDVLSELVTDKLNAIAVVLASSAENGIVLAGISVPGSAQRITVPGPGRDGTTTVRSHAIMKGFRSGKIPPALLTARYFQRSDTVTRFQISRADHNWVHGRDRDGDQKSLKNASVTLAGCGSLGAPIAETLAQAGVGRISLVDPSELQWANIGRHPLGADNIGNNKAEALASALRRRFPHSEFLAHRSTIEDVLIGSADSLNDRLIINATGNWGALSFIDALNEIRGQSVSAIHCWLERNAVAGHALYSPSGTPCARCAFDNVGVPRFQIARWDADETAAEPECGAVFSSYGPSDLLNTVAMVVDLVIDILGDRLTVAAQRHWIGPYSKLKQYGGHWSEEWQRHPGFRASGGVLIGGESIGDATSCLHGVA